MHRFILPLLLLFTFGPNTQAAPLNFHQLHEQLLRYHDSGVYNTDVKLVTTKATRYLARRVAHNPQQHKLAVMIDVDETALSNFNNIRRLYNMVENVGDRFKQTTLTSLNNTFNDPAIKPTLALYRYAIKHHVAVFFVTGRYDSDYAGTKRNLHQVGYTKYQQLILRKPNQYHLAADTYKQQVAHKIKQAGYDLVLAIGDQYSDLPHQYADASFKVPDPFYYIA